MVVGMTFDFNNFKCRLQPGRCPRCGIHSDKGLHTGSRRVVACGCDLSVGPFRQLMVSLGGQIGTTGDVYGFTVSGVCREGCESCLISHRPGAVDAAGETEEPTRTPWVPGGSPSSETV
jgi:hypothetical protein